MKIAKAKIQLFSSGYCTGNRKHIHKGDHTEKLVFHALWALIEHPELGYIVFDTGYSSRFYDVTKKFPFKLYKWATPVFHEENQSCKNTLLKKGLRLDDINHVVISHFHADHIGGIRDFPNAKKWYSKSAIKHFQNKNNWSGIIKGYIKPFVPENISGNYPEDIFLKIDWNGFKAWKWKEDLLFVDLPGHSRGQIGLFIKDTNLGDVFLLADASWSLHAIRERVYPSQIVKIFVDDYNKLTKTIDKLHHLSEKYPEIILIPSHCSEIAERFLF